ncbi:hypothetical protein BDN67DRAFT_181841 [Paxillus ammoniavirescens]|nr:hypothetical protein BDN67DRAFT_181841 [Paxillus ammoniavirescens]
MKAFFTLLTAITSLSAYTLVGVHAVNKCSTCPTSTGGVPVWSACVDHTGVNHCEYRNGAVTLYCYYSSNGSRTSSSHQSCPKKMDTTNVCPPC